MTLRTTASSDRSKAVVECRGSSIEPSAESEEERKSYSDDDYYHDHLPILVAM